MPGFPLAQYAAASPLGQLTLQDILRLRQAAPRLTSSGGLAPGNVQPGTMSPAPPGQGMVPSPSAPSDMAPSVPQPGIAGPLGNLQLGALGSAAPGPRGGFRGFLDRMNTGAGQIQQRLGDAVFPVDPTTAASIDPAQLQGLKRSAMLQMGLGMLAHSRAGFGPAALGSLGLAQGQFQGQLGNLRGIARQAGLDASDQAELARKIAADSADASYRKDYLKYLGEDSGRDAATAEKVARITAGSRENVANIRGPSAAARGFTFKASDANAIRNNTLGLFGGIFDPMTGQIRGLQPGAEQKVAAINARAQELYQDGAGGLTHGQAVALAARDAGIEVPEVGATPQAAPGAPPAAPRVQAPSAALEYLKKNPQMRDQFRAKYGYLPPGI